MKIGDTVRIKTITELKEVGICWQNWDDVYQDLIGQEVVVTGLSLYGSIYVNGLLEGTFCPSEYVVEKPTKKKITKKELIDFLVEHGLELED